MRTQLLALSLLLCLCMQGCAGKAENIPPELLAFAESYPQAADFVRNYPTEAGREHEIDISGELTGGIPLFLQWDTRWGYEPYGDGWIGNNGCGPTSLSMVLAGLTGDPALHPKAIAAYAEAQGWYIPGTGTSWELLTTGAEHFGIHSEEGELTADYIRQNVSPETPLIASMRPGDFTTGGHLIVLTGIDESGKVTLHDPNSPANSAVHWDMDVLLPQIKKLWKYTK